jgi:5-methylcytosine-specific restriction endonuclease McrA
VSDSPDYEKEASERLRHLAEKLVDDLAEHHDLLWLLGDGYGGHIFNVIQETFYKRYGYPQRHVPDRSKKITTKIRRLVFERDAYRCVRCNTHLNLCVDHKHPWSKGGSDEIDNLQTLCRSCNSKKKDKMETLA